VVGSANHCLSPHPPARFHAGGGTTAPLTIERLITDGWEVAGYISAWENRSLILFKHKEHK
jgi:hypothetical protein